MATFVDELESTTDVHPMALLLEEIEKSIC